METCIFCKIIAGEIPAKKAFESDTILAFFDITPQAPIHLLVIPKIHIESMNDVSPSNIRYIQDIFLQIPVIAKELGISEKGYRVVNNCGRNGGQTVGHIHFHILGGRGLHWPPG